MFENLKGKKLLILGGFLMATQIVKRAQEMGVYVYVADYESDGPAKQIANQAVVLDVTNVDEIVGLCKKENIDGITTGYVDILLKPCFEACKQLGVPYYASEKLIEVSTNKEAFKQMCNQYNVPVPRTFHINSDNYEIEADNIEYPVFVKPLDASGSRGAAVCNNKEEFINQYRQALEFSKSKNVIVEEYLVGTDIILDYLLIDGKPYLQSLFDRKVTDDRASAVNYSNMCYSPTNNLKQYIVTLDEKVKRMFEAMGFKDGIIFLQGYANGDKITFFEMGCRLGGTFADIPCFYNGINPIDCLIHHALTGKMVSSDFLVSINPKFSGIGAVINFISSKNKGYINKITGLEEIKKMPEVVNCIEVMKEGTFFDLERITDVAVLILYLVAPDLEHLKSAINKIYTNIEIVDDLGKSILRSVYPVDKLTEDIFSV